MQIRGSEVTFLSGANCSKSNTKISFRSVTFRPKTVQIAGGCVCMNTQHCFHLALHVCHYHEMGTEASWLVPMGTRLWR